MANSKFSQSVIETKNGFKIITDKGLVFFEKKRDTNYIMKVPNYKIFIAALKFLYSFFLLFPVLFDLKLIFLNVIYYIVLLVILAYIKNKKGRFYDAIRTELELQKKHYKYVLGIIATVYFYSFVMMYPNIFSNPNNINEIMTFIAVVFIFANLITSVGDEVYDSYLNEIAQEIKKRPQKLDYFRDPILFEYSFYVQTDRKIPDNKLRDICKKHNLNVKLERDSEYYLYRFFRSDLIKNNSYSNLINFTLLFLIFIFLIFGGPIIFPILSIIEYFIGDLINKNFLIEAYFYMIIIMLVVFKFIFPKIHLFMAKLFGFYIDQEVIVSVVYDFYKIIKNQEQIEHRKNFIK